MSSHSKHRKWLIGQLWHWLNPTINFFIPLSPFLLILWALVIISKNCVFYVMLFSVRRTQGNWQFLDKTYPTIFSPPPSSPAPAPPLLLPLLPPLVFQHLCLPALCLSLCSRVSHWLIQTRWRLCHKHFTLTLCSILFLHTQILMPNT